MSTDKKINSISELESRLPSLFKVSEFLKEYQRYAGPFGSRLKLYNQVLCLDPNFDMSKFLISAGVYAKISKEAYEQGYFGISSTKKAKEEYFETLNHSPGRIFEITINHKGYEKSLKKIESMIVESLGKLQASRKVLRSAYSNSDSPYDRNLIMQDYFHSRLLNTWHNRDDVYYIKGVGSIMTSLRTVRNSELKEYINSI